MSERTLRVGVVGCGNISGIYLGNARKQRSFEVVVCADLDPERARAKAREFGVARATTTAELLGDPSVECVLDLTVPGAHFDVGMRAVRAGKHLYGEKPLCIRRTDALALMAEADRRGVRIGCAPDTFLGAGLQTCRELIDSGAIGRPVAATANMVCRGHESWHPDPAFYYKVGGGPMLDMGPYYLTALVGLLGPVWRVRGLAQAAFPERTISSRPRAGETIEVEVPTHVVGLLEFVGGVAGTITTTFDIWASNAPLLEVHGTEGSLSLPDPNGFGGPVRIWRPSKNAWEDVPVARPYAENWRGIGLADMAQAIRTKRPHRASGRLALHVLDVMESIHDAAASGAAVELRTTCERPEALEAGWTA
jgi:predicted dehydrogenase